MEKKRKRLLRIWEESPKSVIKITKRKRISESGRFNSTANPIEPKTESDTQIDNSRATHRKFSENEMKKEKKEKRESRADEDQEQVSKRVLIISVWIREIAFAETGEAKEKLCFVLSRGGLWGGL